MTLSSYMWGEWLICYHASSLSWAPRTNELRHLECVTQTPNHINTEPLQLTEIETYALKIGFPKARVKTSPYLPRNPLNKTTSLV